MMNIWLNFNMLHFIMVRIDTKQLGLFGNG